MNAIAENPTALAQASSEAWSFRWWRLLPFGALWMLPCVGLAIHWRLNPQYHFGWFVPLFALGAGYLRWRTRPAPGAPLAIGLWLAIVTALAVFPTWIFAQPNPDWPLLNWLLTAEIAVVTLAVIAAVGGASWLRHFAFPVALIFTAVPWPDAIESVVTQGLMRSVAAIAVSILDVAGVGALQHGSLIEVATGAVEVEEACSGIRSLVGSLMASLVLGELYRFNVTRRIVLVGASLGAALVTNVFRASFLAWAAARSGVAAADHWHDPAGMTILLVCIGLIFLVALWLDRDAPSPPAWSRVPPAAPLPAWLSPALSVWVLAIIATGELYYYDPAPPPENPLAWHLPAEHTPIEVSARVRAAFHADAAAAARWTQADGSHWQVFLFDWNFGPAFSRVAASMHHPDVCLPAGGRELNETRGVIPIAAAGTTLPFQGYSFREGEQLLFVYHGLWQSRSARGLRHGPLSWNKRDASVQSVLWRERRLGQQAAEIIVSGYRTAAEADAAMRKLVPQLIVANSL